MGCQHNHFSRSVTFFSVPALPPSVVRAGAIGRGKGGRGGGSCACEYATDAALYRTGTNRCHSSKRQVTYLFFFLLFSLFLLLLLELIGIFFCVCVFFYLEKTRAEEYLRRCWEARGLNPREREREREREKERKKKEEKNRAVHKRVSHGGGGGWGSKRGRGWRHSTSCRKRVTTRLGGGVGGGGVGRHASKGKDTRGGWKEVRGGGGVVR